MEEKILDISWATILKIFFAAIVIYLLFLAKDVLILFLYGVIISLLFDPLIFFLSKKIPRLLSTIFVYTISLFFLSLLFYLPAASFVSEIRIFLDSLPLYFEKASPLLKEFGIIFSQDVESFTDIFSVALKNMSSSILNTLFTIFGGVFSTFFVLSIAFFISLEQEKFEKNLVLFFPKKYEGIAMSLWNRSQKKVSSWFLVSILRSIFVGVISYISFLVLKVEYPITLAFIGGVLNFIPFLGPIFSTIIIFSFVALESLTKAILAVILFLIIQQIENNILAPILSKKFIGISPVLILMSFVVGGKFFGIFGAVLTVPLVAILYDFTIDFLKKRKREE